jgi:hypothetical protein
MRHLLAILALGLSSFGCTSSSADGSGGSPSSAPPPPFDEAPIVVQAYDPVGTFFLTLKDTHLTQVSGEYQFGYDVPLSLSPARKRLAQAIKGDWSESVEVYPIEPNAAPLVSFEAPGLLLGWDGEDVLLFLSWKGAGITRVRLSTGAHTELPFPQWVTNENGPTVRALSPDARAAAFVAWTDDPGYEPGAELGIVMDTRNGKLLDKWLIPPGFHVIGIHWASDGKILFYSDTDRFLIGERGEAVLVESPPLPFNVCEVTRWTTPGTVHMTRRVPAGDISHCEESWVVTTDGAAATQRPDPAPSAVSPDGMKILVQRTTTTSTAAVADPDGSHEVPLSEWPSHTNAAEW